MSFTTLVKNEVTKQELNKAENIALLSAYFNSNAIVNTKISISTENASIARTIFKLIKTLYSITPLVRIKKQAFFQKQHLYTIEIYDLNNFISDDLTLLKDGVRQLIPNDYIVADEETTRAYLMGVFLARGSINDPKTARYHLEFILDQEQQAEYLKSLLNRFDLNAKIIERHDHHVVYLKEAEKISDFLRIINTSNAVMYYEDIRIYRDHKNMTNRLNNCEQANIDKIINSSQALIEDIEFLKAYHHFESLPDKLKITAEYKLKYPETSILELSKIISLETGNEISKSGLNHRIRQIKEIVSKIRK